MIVIYTKDDSATGIAKTGRKNIYEARKLDNMEVRLLVETYILPENNNKEATNDR